jgi:alkanesulfonate monooxygenase SsuD/methylene tetrahydromethanopterin reductase-like flavin-dependent oxidoreductase (luciferase family)
MSNPKPIQQPLPICIGGKGRTRTIPLAARFAHHWNYSGGDTAEFVELRELLQQHRAAAGREAHAITCSMLARYDGDEDALRRSLTAMAEADVDLAIVSVPKSEPPDVIERIAAVIGAGG